VRLIFLDFDGVMLNFNDIRRGARMKFSDSCVSTFNEMARILEEKLVPPGTIAEPFGVVVSSSWRIGRSPGDMQKLFEIEGVDATVVGLTPDLPWELTTKNARGEEIRAFMKQWKEGGLEIESFVIIDDDIGEIIDVFPDNTVRITNRLRGFTELEANKAIEVLIDG